jgi:hypothetical protein
MKANEKRESLSRLQPGVRFTTVGRMTGNVSNPVVLHGA